LFHKISTPAKSSRRIRPFTSELGDHFVVIIFWHIHFFTFLKLALAGGRTQVFRLFLPTLWLRHSVWLLWYWII
jgi:hypothetical protein